MRIIENRRNHFVGTHKGATIEIVREHPPFEGFECKSRFYIWVIARDGGMLYDGCCPVGITTMAAAKREAIRGACLDKPSPVEADQ